MPSEQPRLTELTAKVKGLASLTLEGYISQADLRDTNVCTSFGFGHSMKLQCCEIVHRGPGWAREVFKGKSGLGSAALF